MQKKIEKLGELIKKSNNIILISHVRMDPDTFGSQASLYYILEKVGKNIIATNDELPPDSFSFLGANNIIKTGLDFKKFNPDLIISLDAASKGQLGETYINNQEIFNNTPFVVIDHHMTNTGFGSINIIDAKSSSTCELLFTIIESLNLSEYIDTNIATILTAGIHTDTNIFYNSNTTAETLRIAAKLMEYGADFRSPMFNFFKKKEFNKTKLWGEVLSKLERTNDGKIIWALITKDLFEKTNTTNRETTGLINDFFSNIDGMEVCFLLYEMADGKTKASFRSKNFSVGNFCSTFPGGGGHHLAAGFTSNLEMNVIEQEILEKLKKETF